MKKSGKNSFHLEILPDFWRTLKKPPFFWLFRLFLLLGKANFLCVLFGFLHAVY